MDILSAMRDTNVGLLLSLFFNALAESEVKAGFVKPMRNIYYSFNKINFGLGFDKYLKFLGLSTVGN